MDTLLVREHILSYSLCLSQPRHRQSSCQSTSKRAHLLVREHILSLCVSLSHVIVTVRVTSSYILCYIIILFYIIILSQPRHRQSSCHIIIHTMSHHHTYVTSYTHYHIIILSQPRHRQSSCRAAHWSVSAVHLSL
jgi:hypothetical protein